MIGLGTRGAVLQPPPPLVPEWIICVGRARAVADGLVVCPAGFYMPWTRCLQCRHLQTAQNDRQPERYCVAGESRAEEPWKEEAPVSWGQLIVELL